MSGQYPQGGSDPVNIMRKMENIEDDLNGMLSIWPAAEATFITMGKLTKKLGAKHRLALKGTGTVPDIDAMVEQKLWAENAEAMSSVLDAEATIEGCKAKYKLLEKLLSSLQSRLKTERDLSYIPPQPNLGP